jgi:hypothetical protein
VVEEPLVKLKVAERSENVALADSSPKVKVAGDKELAPLLTGKSSGRANDPASPKLVAKL